MAAHYAPPPLIMPVGPEFVRLPVVEAVCELTDAQMGVHKLTTRFTPTSAIGFAYSVSRVSDDKGYRFQSQRAELSSQTKSFQVAMWDGDRQAMLIVENTISTHGVGSAAKAEVQVITRDPIKLQTAASGTCAMTEIKDSPR